jgi:nucleotide-binding universal stress UspA family protein
LVALNHDSSMIIVGAGRHAPGSRDFGGERARRVIRHADRPVLVVRPDFRDLPKTVVVGMDFSAASVRAARAALLMLGDEGRLVLVHVCAVLELPTVPPTLVFRDTSFDALVSRWRQEEELESARLMRHLRDELRPYVRAGITVETRSRCGNVVGQLLGVAGDVDADMIAVGTRGPGIFERFFLGSVALDALWASTRTVLVAPAPPPTEGARLELRLRGTARLKRTEDWEGALDAFSKRNAGRRVRLEVDDPDIGAQVQESGFALLGVIYDRHDRRIEIMVGDPNDRTHHLTRTVSRPDDVAFYATPDGHERALRVARGRGQTLLTFLE